MWLASGGIASMESYFHVPKNQKEKHITFYESLTNYHIDDNNRLFVHAGFTNVNGINYEHYKNLVYWDRTLWGNGSGIG